MCVVFFFLIGFLFVSMVKKKDDLFVFKYLRVIELEDILFNR